MPDDPDVIMSTYLVDFNEQLSKIQCSIQSVNERQKRFEEERRLAKTRWKKIDELKRKVSKLRSMKQINMLLKRSELKQSQIIKLESTCENKAGIVDEMELRVTSLKNEILLQTQELKDSVDNLEVEQQKVKDKINLAIEKETKVEKIEEEISRVKMNISGLRKFVEMKEERESSTPMDNDIGDRITRLRKHRDELKRQKDEMDRRCQAQSTQIEHFRDAHNRQQNELKRNTAATRQKVQQFIENPRSFFDDEQKGENWSEETSGGVSSEVSISYGHSDTSVQSRPMNQNDLIASVSVSASISQFDFPSESVDFDDDVEELTGEYAQYLIHRSQSMDTFKSESTCFSPTAHSVTSENTFPGPGSRAKNGFNIISYSRSVTPGRYESHVDSRFRKFSESEASAEDETDHCDSPEIDRERSIESKSSSPDPLEEVEVDEKYLFELSHEYRINSVANVLDMFPPSIIECIIGYFSEPITFFPIHHWQFPYIISPSSRKTSTWQLLLTNKMICTWEESFVLGLPYIIRIEGCRLSWINCSFVLFKPQEDQLGWVGFDHNENGFHPYVVFEDHWEVKVDRNCYYCNKTGFLKARWSDNLGNITRKMILKIDREFPALVEAASSTEIAI